MMHFMRFCCRKNIKFLFILTLVIALIVKSDIFYFNDNLPKVMQVTYPPISIISKSGVPEPTSSYSTRTAFTLDYHPPVHHGHRLVEKELPFQKLQYPLEINMKELVTNITNNTTTDIAPINVYPYSYSTPSENFCESTKNVFLLFMIKSEAGNFDQRQAIRETWVKKAYFQKDVIRHVFLLARSTNETINDLIFLEKWMYRDIVKMSFIDGYFNNTYKTTGGINLSVKYCPTSRFVMLVDDDIYVSTHNLLKYLHTVPKSIFDSFFAGAISSDVPQRKTHQKWYMPVKEYPFKRYPPFLSAGSVLMTMDYVKRLQIAMQFTKSFKFDDVFLGIVACKLDVKPIHHPEIKMMTFISYKTKSFETIIASHGYGTPNELRTAWYHHLRIMQTNNETIERRASWTTPGTATQNITL